MIYELSQEFYFEAAHTLARTVPLVEYEPSRRIHGHTYTASVTVVGEKGADGILGYAGPRGKRRPLDLFYLRAAIARVRDKLDHRMLDDVVGLGPATLENLATFIFAEVSEELPVSVVTVRRPSSGDSCVLRGTK